jgi:hypothetical protein
MMATLHAHTLRERWLCCVTHPHTVSAAMTSNPRQTVEIFPKRLLIKRQQKLIRYTAIALTDSFDHFMLAHGWSSLKYA